MDTISIIVPVYNVEKYLDECIKTLINQSYTNLEIILVDDGSTDSSGEICDKYAQSDPRISVIHKQNAGLGLARNSGLKEVTGSYVTFIDSDDYADADLVKSLVDGLKKNNADTCIGGFKRINDNGDILFQEIYKEEVYKDEAVYDNLFARMLGSSPNSHDAIRMSVWNTLYSMDIIRNNQIVFPSERQYISEDIIWDIEYFKHARTVQIIAAATYNYRITPGSLTKKYNPERFRMICDLYVEVKKRLNSDEEKIQRLQRQFFINLRACISQEHKGISAKSRAEIKRKLSEIVSNKFVVEIINDYPINKIQIKQRIFLLCIQARYINILYLLLYLKII